MFPLAVFGWIASLVIFIRIKGIPVHIGSQVHLKEALPIAQRLFIPLIAFMFFRSFLITGMGVYLPTLLQGQGASVWKADISLTIYQLAGVFGAFFGGTISDRHGRKPILFIVSLLAPLTVLFFLSTSGWMALLVLIFAGIFGLSSQPIMLAIVQDHLPDHRSVGNGLFMAINFICLSVAAVGIGMLADRMTLYQAFQVTAICGLIAVPFIFWLPTPPARVNTQQ
jgi:FSR family fosmidomycin resistance protein-like MFS transporter